MKFKFILLSLYILIVSFSSVNAYAQKLLHDGILSYDISIESTKGEKEVAGSLNGAVLTVYLSKDKSRTEMKSAPGTETLIYNNITGKGTILKEYSGQKLMITATAENWAQKNQVNNSLQFQIDDDFVNIAGYKCRKATATGNDGKTYVVYFDPATLISNKTYNNSFPQLKGLPVQYELRSGNLIFKYTLVKYNAEEVAPGKFDIPKSGFRVMTYEENQQLKKGN